MKRRIMRVKRINGSTSIGHIGEEELHERKTNEQETNSFRRARRMKDLITESIDNISKARILNE